MATSVLGTLGNIDELSIGGRIITNVPSPTNTSSTLITLTAMNQTATAWSTFRLTNGSAGYQVTAGKTLYIAAIQITTRNPGSGVGIQIGYANTDAGFGGSAPTTPIYFGGDILNYVGSINSAGTSQVAPNFPVPATKYAFMYLPSAASVSMIAYCYEV